MTPETDPFIKEPEHEYEAPGSYYFKEDVDPDTSQHKRLIDPQEEIENGNIEIPL